MLVDTVVASVVVGKLRGGTLSSLGGTPIKKVELIVAALAAEAAAVIVGARGWAFGPEVGSLLFLASYLTLLYAISSNRHLRWMPLVGLGVALNWAVILANGMRMPVSLDALAAAGMARQAAAIASGAVSTYRAMDPATRLAFLGDVIPIGPPYPIHRVVSVGDIVMALGVFLLVQHEMFARRGRTGAPTAPTPRC